MVSAIHMVEMTSVADSVEQRLLRCLSGQQTECDHYLHVIAHLKFMLQRQGGQPDEFLHFHFHQAQSPMIRFLEACCATVNRIRETPKSSLNKILLFLQERQIFASPEDADEQRKILLLVFRIILWMTHVAVPASIFSTTFKVDKQGAKYPSLSSLEPDKAQRPLGIMLRGLGESLPRYRPGAESQGAVTKFQVSSLNAMALKEVGGMKFVWVDSISAHLDLNPSIPALYLFRVPSFCKTQAYDDSLLSIFATELCLPDDDTPSDFSLPRLMDEIMLSYQLLFRHESRSRKLYSSVERRRAGIADADGGHSQFDPCLDQACGHGSSPSWLTWHQPTRETYHADSDFPMLNSRLQRLHLYMEGIQTNRVVSLWRDRRDRRMWLTFWTVLIFGAFAFVQGMVGNVLAGIQVWYAKKGAQG